MKRFLLYWLQRRIRGFDDRDLYALDEALYKWLLPRLERFLELYSRNIDDKDSYQVVLEAVAAIKGNKIIEDNFELFYNNSYSTMTKKNNNSIKKLFDIIDKLWI